jgi:hypothetical protein
MVRQQRFALFNLIISVSALTAFAVLIPALGTRRAQAGFAVMALIALGPMLFRARAAEVSGDERDRAIHLRATQITAGILWLLFVSAMMASLYWFPAIRFADFASAVVWLGAAALFICHSTCLLILYRYS